MHIPNHSEVERREGYIELPHDFVTSITDHVSKEEQFWKNFKVFASLYTALFSIILAIGTWVLLEKNTDIKEMQKNISEHSKQIERTLTMLEVLVRSDARQDERVNKMNERLYQKR